ncbi:pre-peptidase C-terminal domain-containing protein [Hazenella sp. IB182357]|uniref:Pre-peptidase C-terminal domain-containing protein n=2 Tax=Polycladospora coralii TaxID=2771432 RepID=A0A926NC16_9BACL|nr:pre-peptidase C-terminal domain-containing protein [Polycladospora coralii]
MSRFSSLGMLCMMFVFTLQTVYMDGISVVQAAADSTPEIRPTVVNDNAGKKVLFDNTHGQTAGAADWVIDGGFSDFANGLASDGFYVRELRKTTPITYADLQSYDVFVIGEANVPYKQSEQNAMIQYVENGGSIFFIGDHYNADRNKNRWDASEVFNGYRRGAYNDPAKGMSSEERNSVAMQGVISSDWLGQNFGIRFRYNALGNVTANHIVSPSQTFGITTGVSTVAMHAGSTLAITDPRKAKGIVYLPSTNEKWRHAVDQGVYKGGGVEEGPYAAIAKRGKGKAAFIGDSSPVEDATPKYKREETGGTKKTYDGFKEQDDAVLLVNMVNWLADQENYTSFEQVNNFQLDQATPLLSFETPASSTEPKSEPWAEPSSGYKWYDPSTFKAGSYVPVDSEGIGGNGDTYENNDVMSSAYGPLTSGETYKSQISSKTDTDWYKISLSTTSNLTVNLANLPGDYDLYLYNQSGNQLASSENENTNSEKITYSGASGTLYIKVNGYGGAMSTSQSYHLTASYGADSNTAKWYYEDKTFSTPHPYGNDYNNGTNHKYTKPGATKVALHFSRFETEADYDKVYIKDKNGATKATYHGTKDAFWVEVDGDTIISNLVTDQSINGYGYNIDQVAYYTTQP